MNDPWEKEGKDISSNKIIIEWIFVNIFFNKVNDNLTLVDGLVGQLMDGLVERGLDTCANVIVVSDHGNSLPVSPHHSYQSFFVY